MIKEVFGSRNVAVISLSLHLCLRLCLRLGEKLKKRLYLARHGLQVYRRCTLVILLTSTAIPSTKVGGKVGGSVLQPGVSLTAEIVLLALGT